MDADPLYHVKQLFYQGSFKGVYYDTGRSRQTITTGAGFDMALTALPPAAAIEEASTQPLTPGGDSAALSRAVYVARAHLALNPPAIKAAEAVLAPWIAEEAPSARAAAALASYLATKEGVDDARDILLEVEGTGGEEATVRALVGTVFILENETEEAVATLSEGAGAEDLECVALLVQLCLTLDRRDLAAGQYALAKRIGNDSTLVQAIEAWIGLKTGGRALHQAYYFYEELYQLPNGRTSRVLASHAAAHLLLGHVDEAKADLSEAIERGADEPAVLAVATSLGDEDAQAKLATTSHPFALDLAEKNKLFDEAAAKFAVAA